MDLTALPVGGFPPALSFKYFPTRFQAVIWRNWNLVSTKRLAEALNATEDQIEASAALMGLKKIQGTTASGNEYMRGKPNNTLGRP